MLQWSTTNDKIIIVTKSISSFKESYKSEQYVIFIPLLQHLLNFSFDFLKKFNVCLSKRENTLRRVKNSMHVVVVIVSLRPYAPGSHIQFFTEGERKNRDIRQKATFFQELICWKSIIHKKICVYAVVALNTITSHYEKSH